jgi:transposase
VQELLSKCGGPTGLRKASRRKLLALVASRAPRMGTRLVEAILTALDEQTVSGTAAAETVLPRLADSRRKVLQQRDQIAGEVQRILDAHPLAGVLTSMPGIGVRTGARILLEVGDASAFATPGSPHRLRQPRPVPPLRQQHPRGEHPPKSGNKQLKRAFFLAAFASLPHPPSRA